MRRGSNWGYLPAQRMRYLCEELRRLEGRFAAAEDPALIEALIYENASLMRQQSACLRQAREQEAQRRAREEEAFFHE